MDNPQDVPPHLPDPGPSTLATAIPNPKQPFQPFQPQHPRLTSLRDLSLMINSRRRATTLKPMRGVGTGWLDEDDSGTYDPKLQRATPPDTPPKRKKRICINNGTAQRPGRNNRAVGYSLLMTFSFTSEKSLDYLKSIPAGPFDKEQNYIEVSDFESESEDELTRPSRRKRKATKSRATRNDGMTIAKLTIGHPQRRGCKSCFLSGNDECSLIANSNEYPCEACGDGDLDCELIIQPELKKACERCKHKRISCSYIRGGGKGVKACRSCANAGVKCFAASMKDSSYSRRYDDVLDSSGEVRKPARKVTPRRFVSCNQCRNEALRCNLKRDQPGPCRECRKRGEECGFILLLDSSRLPSTPPPPLRPGRKLKNKQQTKAHRQAQTPGADISPNGLETQLGIEGWWAGAGRKRPSLDPRAGWSKKQEKLNKQHNRLNASSGNSSSPELIGMTNGLRHIKITTAFSHPIHFNYIPAPNGQFPCSWCEVPFFGLHGHGELVVEVIPWEDGQGYEEVGEGKYEGHCQKGLPETTMCVPCTWYRIQIMACKNHEMSFMDDVDPRSYDQDEWIKAINAIASGDMEGGKLVWEAKYCSICPSIAEYRCCAQQPILEEGEAEVLRCGLLLCENCKDLLGKVQVGKATSDQWEKKEVVVLDRLIDMVGKAKWQYEDGPRADASFLASTGELSVRIIRGMDEEVPDSEEQKDGWMDDISEQSGDSDEERELIYQRIGKGRGTWMEKFKGEPSKKSPLLKNDGWLGPPLQKPQPLQNGLSRLSSHQPASSKSRRSSRQQTYVEVERTGKSIAANQDSFGGDFMGFSMGSAKPTIGKPGESSKSAGLGSRGNITKGARGGSARRGRGKAKAKGKEKMVDLSEEIAIEIDSD